MPMLKDLEEEKANIYGLIQQKKLEIRNMSDLVRQEQAKHEELQHLISAVKSFDTRLSKILHTNCVQTRDKNAFSWETLTNPLPYFQSYYHLQKIEVHDNVAYLQSTYVGTKVFDLFVIMPSTKGGVYRIDLVQTPEEKVFKRGFVQEGGNTWEHVIFEYVDKRLPQDVCKSFHNIEDLVAWLRAIRHPEIRISHEPYLNLPCVDTFSGLRITCDGLVRSAWE